VFLYDITIPPSPVATEIFISPFASDDNVGFTTGRMFIPVELLILILLTGVPDPSVKCTFPVPLDAMEIFAFDNAVALPLVSEDIRKSLDDGFV
jgi:hypothetical protein